ncbi:hypothetical protein [Polycladomyces subterraneus]|uniref:Uncharacterized protein n=1 Tax=Polycladomyces subterraneus TaxID=1016997 RepID=A0ABT8ILW1_9BACL|nr:hypothetical protein [Polycladomyces subterraneus]MDN4593727.1 hypothetical protein [Polycladomyces subterraneus]
MLSVVELEQQGMKSGKQGTAQSTEPAKVEFKGQATIYDIHYFYYAGGIGAPYYLVNADTLRFVEDQHNMPTGNYYLITFGLVGAAQPYDFTLSGEGLIPENSYPEQAHFTTQFPFGNAHFTRLKQGEEDQVQTLTARVDDGTGYVYLND